MLQPTDEVLNRTSGTFADFLERNNLKTLIPLIERIHTTQGYGYLDEIGTLYGLMWNTPKFVITFGLRILGVDKDPFKVYIIMYGKS